MGQNSQAQQQLNDAARHSNTLLNQNTRNTIKMQTKGKRMTQSSQAICNTFSLSKNMHYSHIPVSLNTMVNSPNKSHIMVLMIQGFLETRNGTRGVQFQHDFSITQGPRHYMRASNKDLKSFRVKFLPWHISNKTFKLNKNIRLKVNKSTDKNVSKKCLKKMKMEWRWSSRNKRNHKLIHSLNFLWWFEI